MDGVRNENFGEMCGYSPSWGGKTQLRENTEGGYSGERFKLSCLEILSWTPRCARGRGQHPYPGCPIPTSAQWVFSLLGRVFASLGLFGTLLPLLAGQETPGFGWEPKPIPTTRAPGPKCGEEPPLFLSSSSSSSSPSSVPSCSSPGMRGWA